MRKPIENGLASIVTPRSCSIAKVSRALWPSASTTWPASISQRVPSAPAVTTPRTRPASMRTSTSRVPKRTSPPSRWISVRIFSTTPTRRNVPMCGLAAQADLPGRAGRDEFRDDLARQVARVADLAPELAVGKSAGAALAELHVGFGVEHAAPPEAPGVLRPLAHGAAAFDHDRPQAHLREQQRGEQAARPEADDDRAERVG